MEYYGREVNEAIAERMSEGTYPCGEEMREYKVPVYWTMMGYVTVTASSPSEAMEKVRDNIDDYDLPHGEYLDESFEVDESGEAFEVHGEWS